MAEQLYECPKCKQQYTFHTISLHYGCGVAPFDTPDEIAEPEEFKALETPVIREPKKRGRKPSIGKDK